MPEHSETRHFSYTAQELFDVVIDIKKYPEFLPWVLGLRVREHDFSARKMHAELAVGYKIYTERFTCNVSYETDKSIHVDYLKGPLKHLSNNWVFTDLKEGGCAVDFLSLIHI